MAFNLANGQRAERKLLITVAEWATSEGSGTEREILGTRTEDSSIEYNPDVETTTDIRGINYTDVNKVQPQQDFDPYLILGGSKLGVKLNDIRRRNALTELSSFTVYIITAYDTDTITDEDTGTTSTVYKSEKHSNCTILYTSLGGDANVNMPISVYFSNDNGKGEGHPEYGTVDKLTEDFVFTAEG